MQSVALFGIPIVLIYVGFLCAIYLAVRSLMRISRSLEEIKSILETRPVQSPLDPPGTGNS